MNLKRYEEVLSEANELRWKAIELESAGHHALAELKMHELDLLVRAADAEAAQRSKPVLEALKCEAKVRDLVELELRLELGEAV